MRKRCLALAITASVGFFTTPSAARVGGQGSQFGFIPTGQRITATAAAGSIYLPLTTSLRQDASADAAEGVTSALSPDGKTLLVLTSGYNRSFKTSNGAAITFPLLDPLTGKATSSKIAQAEWIFVFDVSRRAPKKLQQLNVPNTYDGLVWDPNGGRFYVSGGIDDRVYAFRKIAGTFAPDPPFILLGHNSEQTAPLPKYDGGLLKNARANVASHALLATGAVVAGLGIDSNRRLFAANMENDSMSVVDAKARRIIREIHFFVPGQRVARGEYPYWIAIKSAGKGRGKVYVSSLRDDQVIVARENASVKYVRVGSGPNRLLLSKDQGRLYVCNGNSDSVSVLDTRSDQVVGTIALTRRGYPFKGANPNALALSGDGRMLFVTLGGENAVAFIDVRAGRVIGRVPTGWYPSSVSAGSDGKMLYVVNAKSNAGPNPSNDRTTFQGTAMNRNFRNDYNWALEKAGLLAIPLPLSIKQLANLSSQVDRNNGFMLSAPASVMTTLRRQVKHVIYIVNENRTYDQVLGDLPGANGEPALTLFPRPLSPNHHELQTEFVTLDNFFDSGESSGVGWNWSMMAHTTDFTEKSQSVLYGNAGFKGLTYDYQGTNRNINVGLPEASSRTTFFDERITSLFDPSGRSSILPGSTDVAAGENADNDDPGAVGGYLWDTALRAGKSIRNYGWQVDQIAYGSEMPLDPALVRHPFEKGVEQAAPINRPLRAATDVYYRGFDQRYPDQFRIEEWLREFKFFVANNSLPNLEMMTIPHDHFGSFGKAIEGLNTPTLQFADNDYAIGELVQAVSHSRYWQDTAIFIIEDDSQNGPDHVDGHRSIAYIISPYTRRHSMVHTRYTTVNVLRTIEDILGARPVSMFDANASPMVEAFTATADQTPYEPYVPGVLCHPPVAVDLLGAACRSERVTAAPRALHNGQWWAAHTAEFDFSAADRADAFAFERVLWNGTKGAPLPSAIGRTHI